MLPDARDEPEADDAQPQQKAEVEVGPNNQYRHENPGRPVAVDHNVDEDGEQEPAKKLRPHRPVRRADEHAKPNEAERDDAWRAQPDEQALHEAERDQRERDE